METLNLRHYNMQVVSYLFICIIIMQLFFTTWVKAVGLKENPVWYEQSKLTQQTIPIIQSHLRISTFRTANMVQNIEKKVEKTSNRPLEEILADNNACTVELIPYLQGSYEDNKELLAHLMQGECRGGSDESMQYAGLIAINRAFDPQASDGTGDLESAIFMDGQYVCTWDGSFYQTPSEDCYRNAEAILNQDLLDQETPTNLFYMATVKFKGKAVYTTLQEGGKTVYIQYKW